MLWYDYSEHLLSLLPDRIRKEIKFDQDKLKMQNSSRNQQYFVDIRFQTDSRTATVEYRKTQHEQVGFSIYDVQGGKKESFIPDRPCDGTFCSETVHLGDLEPGIYRLAVSTDDGRRVVNWVYTE